MIKVQTKGNWNRTDKFFKKSTKVTKIEDITLYAEEVMKRLKAETPKDSGITSDSWDYTIIRKKGVKTLYITNSNIQNGVKVALMVEFGHATVSGTWVEGKNFIGKITRDVYNKILSDTWKELRKL